jgi:hypothetical protein
MIDPNISDVVLDKNPVSHAAKRPLNAIGRGLYNAGRGVTRYFDRIAGTGDLDDVMANLKANSALYQVSAASPPTIIVHDADDTTVPYTNSISLHTALDTSGVRNTLITTAGLGHTLGAGDSPGVKVMDWEQEARLINAINEFAGS